MLCAYFDDSGTHADAKAVTMGGYVSTVAKWRQFERATELFFKREGVKLFHAKKFIHGADEFRGWSIERKIGFATDWFSIASKYVTCGAAVSANTAHFREMKKEHSHVSMSAYSSCLPVIVSKLSSSSEVWELIQRHGLGVILEAGIPGRERGVKVTLEALAKANDLGDKLFFKGEAPKRRSRALQLADYLAHFTWRVAEKAADRIEPERSAFYDIAYAYVPTVTTMTEKHVPNPSYPGMQKRIRRAANASTA